MMHVLSDRSNIHLLKTDDHQSHFALRVAALSITDERSSFGEESLLTFQNWFLENKRPVKTSTNTIMSNDFCTGGFLHHYSFDITSTFVDKVSTTNFKGNELLVQEQSSTATLVRHPR